MAGSGGAEGIEASGSTDRGLLKVDPAALAVDQRKPVWWRRLVYGAHVEPIPSRLGVLEPPIPGVRKTGIACSGGGIRSAAFNLGALQVLQEAGVLQKADYLAAVSGGSYIASALAIVNKRQSNGKGTDDSDPALFGERTGPFYRGSPEEQYLRNRSSYMAPGALGKAQLVFRVLLGVIANLGFVLLFIAACAGTLGLLFRWWFPHLTTKAPHFAALHWMSLAGLAAGVVLVFGVLPVTVRFLPLSEPTLEDLLAGVLRFLIVIAAVAFATIAMPELVGLFLRHHASKHVTVQGSPVATAGAVAGGTAASVLGVVVAHIRNGLKEAGNIWQKLGQKARLAVAYLVAALVGPGLLIAFSVWFAALAIRHSLQVHFAYVLGAALLFMVLYSVADLTKWSLHPFYRRRLWTAFVLKRVKRKGVENDRFGEAVERGYKTSILLTDIQTEPGLWPVLLVCAAANISDSAATPPGRAVTSFTFSPYAIGGPLTGGVSTERMEKTIPKARINEFTLPAAVAMSGAAISPSMGKLTKPPLRFLMALANVRLGVWVPNPRCIKQFEEDATRRIRKRVDGPRPRYLLKELLGLNRADDRYLYVTDGGHYENLGLIELLRRGCVDVYCFDASGGTTFKDLGDAVDLARSELNVDIDIDPAKLVPDPGSQLAASNCVVGDITYPPDDHGERVHGRLVYARTVLTVDAPWDVHAYHKQDTSFPHNPTLNQLYSDRRFEAYRALGECAARNALAATSSAATIRRNSPHTKRLRPGAGRWATNATAVAGDASPTSQTASPTSRASASTQSTRGSWLRRILMLRL